MNRALAEAIVECLSFSAEAGAISKLDQFRLRDWERTFSWLDKAGLTLYLFDRLKTTNATDLLPAQVLARFERTLVNNRQRIDCLAAEFASLNQRLDGAGANYAAVKGFSLVPEYCPDAALRPVSDLDYLVDKPSLPLAQRALEEAGYRLQQSSDIELKFVRPSPRIPRISDSPYSRDTELMVELHLAFWSRKANRVPLREPEFHLDQTLRHDWQGLRFPVLTPEDAFVLQVLHVFQHTLERWVKLCWLLEIGYFLKARSADAGFWDRVDARMREVPYLTEFAAVVLGLVEQVFAAPPPSIAAKWTRGMRPGAKVWLDNYAGSWTIQDHPYDSVGLLSDSKLALFLQLEFISDPEVRNQIVKEGLFPWKQPVQIAVRTNATTASVLTAGRLQWQFVLRRFIFHLGATARYFVELPRWRELNRRSAASSPIGSQASQLPGRRTEDLSDRQTTAQSS